MKKVIFAIVIILSANQILAKNAEKKSRWDELMTLVGQEMRILQNSKNKGPELLYRLLELHSEKLKLIHEKNNNAFLELSKKTNVSQKKESLFSETRSYYAITKAFGSQLLKDYPDNKYKPDILFAMALNSRDYGLDKITEKYLLDTISLIKNPHSSLRHHAETALADFYYNEKRYSEGIFYYEKVIKKTEDEWLTKHFFNLSWCYLKNREFDKAIKAIHESYYLSKKDTYININDQVLDNIGSFYVYAGRPMEGLDFYLNNEKDPVPYLLPMASKTSEKGHEKETQIILDSAQRLIDKNDWMKYQEDVFHSYLDFYRHYNRFVDHNKTSHKLVAFYQKIENDKKLNIKAILKDDAIEKIRSLSGFLQIKLSKDMKEDGGSFRDADLELVLSYLGQLKLIDPIRKSEYLYFMGETYYSVRKFVQAAQSYVESVNETKIHMNIELTRKALNSLLALTGMEVMDKNVNKNFLIFAYSEHISFWPRDEKSELIYPKLFEIYREDHLDHKASEVVRSFHKSYPEHIKEQHVMMTKILDLFIEAKNTDKIAFWIHEFKKGVLSFSKDMIEKVEITLGNMLFLQYQEMAKNGQRIAAAKGLESIYVNKLYTDKIKAQSASYASLIYLELGQTKVSFYWQELALLHMDQEEKLSRREEQLKMSERTYKLQDFKTSFKMSSFFLKQYCSLKDEIQNRHYEIAVMTSLVEEDSDAAENIIRQYSDCLKRTESKDIALSQMYTFFEKRGDLRRLRLHVHRYPNERFKNQYRFTLQKWFWEKSNLNFKDLIIQELTSLNHPETLLWVKEIKEFHQAKLALVELKELKIWDQAEFDGDQFNKSLDSFLLKIQKFKSTYAHLASSNQIDLAILSTRMLSSLFKDVGDKISSLRPLGMGPQVVADFSQAMKNVANSFYSTSSQYDKQLDHALNNRETLAWGSRAIASVEKIENPIFSFFTGITMDKSRGE